MAVAKQRLIRTAFALVGVISLIAALLPAIKGEPPNVTFLGVAVFWLIMFVVAGRKPGSGAGGPSA